jgi:hypothetical protein
LTIIGTSTAAANFKIASLRSATKRVAFSTRPTAHPYRRGAASVPHAIPLINYTSLATAGTPRLGLAPTPPPAPAHRPRTDSRPIHTALHTRDHRRPAPPRCAVTVHTRTTTRWQVCSHHGHQLPRPAGHHHYRPAARPVR